MQRSAAAAQAKLRREVFQMLQHFPKELFGQFGGPDLVRVRKAVAAGRRRSADGRERAGMQTQCVTHLIEPQSMSELGEEQTNHMTPGRESSHPILAPGGTTQLGNQMGRNIIAKLPQNGKFAGGWFGSVFIFFHTTPCGVAKAFKPAFSLCPWDACVIFENPLSPEIRAYTSMLSMQHSSAPCIH